MNDVIFIKKDSTNVTVQIKLRDAYNGSLKTGVTITDLDLYYIRVETDNDVTISAKADLTALASLTDAHADNKAYEIGQGYYRLDIPDAAFAAGAVSGTLVIVDGATSPAVLTTTVDYQLVDHILFTAGAIEVTYTMYTDEDAETGPIEGVEIFITTDSAGTNVVWAGTTDANGVLRESAGNSKPWLDAGTYYFFRKKSQYTFDNPDTEVVA